ncbi:TR10B factor, partial [Himantopus himantopus]|nr:TR10B factor [Himantopus himantopus]
EQNGSSLCLPCKEGEYIEYPNDFSKCLRCWTCREDQEELRPCRATSNTQCVCRSSTFCSPDHPCEMCQKCRPRCPDGEVELAPCTPHSDRQCGPPTGTFSGSSSNLIVTIVVVVAVVLPVFLCLWKCGCCRCPGECRGTPERSPRPAALRGCGLGGKRDLPGGRGITAWFLSSRGRERPEQEVLQHGGELLGWGRLGVQDNIRNERKILVPVQGQDPIILLRRSFEFFARDVPYKDWKRYGRALDLLENDIALAEMNDKYSLEPFFQMLNTWHNRQGMNASVNTLLETLHQINLGGIAEDISSKLVQQGFFQYEVS